MRSIILISVIPILILSGCSGDDGSGFRQQTPVNYILLLDLSDRVLLPNQVSNDISLIKSAFNEFAKTVRQKGLVINSKDKFKVVIAPQKGISYDPSFFMNKLYLDMSSITAASKRDSLEGFESNLENNLNGLYFASLQGMKRLSLIHI